MSVIFLISVVLRSTEKLTFVESSFFMLVTVKSFEMLPKHNEYDFISEYFASNWYIFTPLTYKKPLLSF